MNATLEASADPPPAAVLFNQVCKSYKATGVLRNLDLRVDCGSFTGLVGVNGAGKTTLIKCLLDFCDIDSGRIEIFGRPSTNSIARQSLAYLPERFSPPYFLSGAEFLQTAFRLSGRPYTEEWVRTIIQRLQLEPVALAKPVRSLSKGMTQKLGLAASLLLDRRLLVLDEPMSGLDPRARASVKAVLAERKSAGDTLLMTSHSLADISEICDHMVVLHQGSVAFSGSPGALREREKEASLERAFLRCIESND